jgi:predicted MPP superfamily phosphohydrolase
MAKYVNGTYELSNGSIMEVSRGLARETTPLPRFFNHPEVVLLKLK